MFYSALPVSFFCLFWKADSKAAACEYNLHSEDQTSKQKNKEENHIYEWT